ncbi:hypothetical protein L7F22_022836 [Adiantum nelumboides]|nr:hypothetical protein [Adiantum nelumboides]
MDPSGSYTVALPLGTPSQSQVFLTLDLNSPLTSLSCSTNLSSDSSFHPSSSSTFRNRTASPQPCANSSSSCNYLAQDSLTLTQRTVYSLNNTTPTPLLSTVVDVAVPSLTFLCASSLPNNSASALPPPIGVAAFSRGRFSIPSQVAREAGLAKEFAYCLSGSIGPVVFGSRPEGYAFQTFPDPPVIFNMSNLHNRLPLLAVKGGKYAVRVEDITISEKSVNLTKPVKMYISTTTRYTRLERSVYKKVREGFRRQIKYGNESAGVVAMSAVPPFDTCFNVTSPSIPDRTSFFFHTAQSGQVSFLLSGNREWPLFTDTLAGVNGDVLCLAMVDAGRREPSVLGTFNQQGRLVHIDLLNRSLAFGQVDNVGLQIPHGLFRYRNCANFV